MPDQRIDPHSGAIVFKASPDDLLILRMRDDIKELKIENARLKSQMAAVYAKLGMEMLLREGGSDSEK